MQKGDGDKKKRTSFTVQLGPEGYRDAVELSEILKLPMAQVVSRVIQSVREGPIQLQVLLTHGVVTPSAQEEYRRAIAKFVDEMLKAADRSVFTLSTGDGKAVNRVAAKKRDDKSE